MSTALRLDRLRLHNFRCFADCSLDFQQDLTVFVAENGRGKTALLDGIGVALGTFVDAVSGTRQFHGFERADVRLLRSEAGDMTPALPTRFVADGYVAGQQVHWSRSLQKYSLRARSSTKDAKSVMDLARSMREGLEHSELQNPESEVQLPLVAFYGTGRLWSEHRLTEGKKKYAIDSRSRLSGYTDCLSSSSSFKGVVAWYENKMNEIADAKFATQLSGNLSLIAAIKEAVRVVLEPTGWQELNWDSQSRSIVVEHPGQGRLPLSALSDGVRNMIALVADIAHRCARLNPHLQEQAARRTAGVLLIDEVDMHLHPQWQQLVVDLLRKAFPALQLIISTHSPHVLSTVNKESIRVIRLLDGQTSIDTPTIQTRGVMSADVLASIMGVDPVPYIDEAIWLTKFRALIEDGEAESPTGQELRGKLGAHFGEDHPLMADCDRLIRFQAFRLKRKSPGEGS